MDWFGIVSYGSYPDQPTTDVKWHSLVLSYGLLNDYPVELTKLNELISIGLIRMGLGLQI